jgi:dTDP-4-dehydrorhamnose 3,5-epimerase-like enzyme
MIHTQYKIFEDERGCLMPINFKELPFIPVRVFTVNSVPKNTIRGGHAHHMTEQLIVCTSGEIKVILHDGNQETEIIITKGQSVFVRKKIWDSQVFLTDDSSIMVLCSTEFNSDDYIKNFGEFLKITH